MDQDRADSLAFAATKTAVDSASSAVLPSAQSAPQPHPMVLPRRPLELETAGSAHPSHPSQSPCSFDRADPDLWPHPILSDRRQLPQAGPNSASAPPPPDRL